MVDLARKFDCFHVVGRANVRIVTERMVVDVFEEGRVHAGEIGQVEAGVEVDRRARQLGIAALEIESRGVTRLGNDAAVDAVIFLIIHHLGIAEELVAPKAIGGAIIGRQHKADVGTDRPGDIGGRFAGGEFAIACLDGAFEHIAGLDRRHHDCAGSGVAAVERALWTFEHLDLAHRALVLVQLGCIGLQNAVYDQRHRAFGIAGAIEAADVDLGVAGFGRTGHDGHPGGELQEVLGADDAGACQRFGRQDVDSRRHVDQPFAVTPCRYEDFAFISDCSSSGLRQRRCRQADEKPCSCPYDP